MTVAFQSRLAPDLTEFLAFKRNHGRAYETEEFRLGAFDNFVAQIQKGRRDLPLPHLIEGWLSRSATTRKHRAMHMDLSLMRQFCLFLQRRDPETVVPDRSFAPPTVASRFVAHIFAIREIRRVLREVRRLRPRFRASTFRTLVYVLYCTGLRFGEATRLRLQDVDLRTRILYIAHSKGKARWVPFDPSLARAIRRYLEERNAIARSRSPASPLFVQPDGSPLLRKTASMAMARLLRRAGLKPAQGRVGPRPFDWRHTFAVHRLTRWYREGVNLHERLGWLSKYMGHEDLLGTEVYLTATPELRAYASRRFAARFWEGRCAR